LNTKRAFSFKCHKIAAGRGRGEALISIDNICFYQTDPETGKIIEKGHALEGQSIANKVIIFCAGKGSSVVQGEGLHQLRKRGTAPQAMIIQEPDTILVAGAVIWRIPLVDRADEEFYRQVKNGSQVQVDADRGRITLMVERMR
jgi:predicted aconitase with swiveling domain